MPWIIAIMMFLTILAGAIGLSLGHALTQLHGTLAGGHTVQIVEANAELRARQVSRVANMLREDNNIQAVRVIPESELLEQLEPWIGTDIRPDELPVPALIDIEVTPGTDAAQMKSIQQRITAIAPSARTDAHEAYMGPIERLMRILMWVAAGAVALMVLVTWAVVVLAARSAHATHRATIDIMHLLGATDLQIARLFQRRMALDAIFGSLLGSVAAGGVLWLLHRSVLATEAELAYMMTLPPTLAIALLVIPLSAVLLAMVTARITVRRTLERTL
ncbi:MAG: FtsX-like permease family protein [Sphingobium sp.]|nr:FtsX-like permease family protein [Sphingobium sp.]